MFYTLSSAIETGLLARIYIQIYQDCDQLLGYGRCTFIIKPVQINPQRDP